MQSRYPEPKVPIRPVLSFSSLTGSRQPEVPAIDSAGQVIWLTSGRAAISLGLRYKGIGYGDEVLLPAYNCATMVSAIESVKAKPIYYKCLENLDPDLDDVAAKIGENTKALLVVHFFGFPQKIDVLKDLCRDYSISLIEDCAHVYFGRYAGHLLGSFGDFSIASAMKFFPVSDGGCLILPSSSNAVISRESAGRVFELKSLMNNLERSVSYRRFRAISWLLRLQIRITDVIWTAIKRRRKNEEDGSSDHEKNEIDSGFNYGSYEFDPRWVNVRISHASKCLIEYLPRRRIVERRREIYRKMLAEFRGDKTAWPLFPDLPDDVVPYVFPLVVAQTDRVFPALKKAGVPISRWEYLEHSMCEVSSKYATQLLQFPCHQELSSEEVGWMIDKIRTALTADE